jgi:uncharacterized protein (TIGR00730 family)
MEKTRPKICVFCGSSPGRSAAYADAARRLGTLIGARGFDLVFGGGYVGLMGEVAHAAKLAGAHVTGVLPAFLRHLEPPSAEEEVVLLTSDLQERKREMLARADAFVVLPGGLGTLDEFFEVVTSAQLQAVDKPMVVIDTDGFYAPLEALIRNVVAQGFAGENAAALYTRTATPDEAMDLLSKRLGRA